MSDRIWRCDLVPQYEAYQEEIHEAIHNVLSSGRYVLAENVAAFEEEFASYIGCAHGIGVNSGTDALILALQCFDLGPGDEVITTPFTAIPTYSAIRAVGAKPVFVEIEPDTFLIDLEMVEAAITERTKAVVPVHLFGNVVDVEKLRTIVGSDVFILEDCAQSHGGSVNGKKSGSLGDIAAFSFYPTKNLGAYGDGGIVVTNNAEFNKRIKLSRMYGMVNKDVFITDGVNSRLDELQAAILRVKLRYLDQMNNRRRELAGNYRSLLDEEFIKMQEVRDNVVSVFHVFSAVCRDNRDALVSHLERHNIQSNVYYPMPLYRQQGYTEVYGDHPPCPAAEALSQKIIALPFYPELAPEKIEFIALEVNRFFEAGRSGK